MAVFFCSCAHRPEIQSSKSLGKVTGVSKDWGFVVIQSEPGVVFQTGDMLSVLRGNLFIGRVRIQNRHKNDVWVADIMQVWDRRIETGDTVFKSP